MQVSQDLQSVKVGVCRKIHADHHNSHGKLIHCKNCDATVVLLNKNQCSCCLEKVLTRKERNSRYNPVRKIMNKVVSKYGDFLQYYEKNLMPNDMIILGQVKHQIILYQVDLKYAILYLNAQEMPEEDRNKAYEIIRKNITEVKLVVSWGRSKTFKLFID